MNNTVVINELNNQDLQLNSYFILPYYEKTSLVYVFINSNNEIKWFNYNYKNIQGYKRINKNLLKYYKESRFHKHPIVLIGFIDKISTFRKFIIFDLLLYEEFIGVLGSKKYSTRLENLTNRFFSEKFKETKNIASIFSYKYDETIFNNIFSQCIIPNRWEGYILHKDCSYNSDIDNEILEQKVWETFEGEIIDATFGTIIVKEKDENDNEIDKPFDGVKSLFVMNEGKKLEISNGLTINERIDFFKNASTLIGKKIMYKYFILNDKDVTLFFKLIK